MRDATLEEAVLCVKMEYCSINNPDKLYFIAFGACWRRSKGTENGGVVPRISVQEIEDGDERRSLDLVMPTDGALIG